MRIVRPIYGIGSGYDYAPGTHLYTRRLKSPLSAGIAWFENQNEVMEYVEGLPSNIYQTGASHVVIVRDELWGYESTFPHTQKVQLSDYFDDPQTLVVCRKLRDIDECTYNAMFEWFKDRLGRDYDLLALGGHFLSILTGLQEIIPSLKKMPPIGHINGHWVCSAFACDAMKQTDKYKGLSLFQTWNVHRIHVHRLWNGLADNYKSFHLDTMRTGAKIKRVIYDS